QREHPGAGRVLVHLPGSRVLRDRSLRGGVMAYSARNWNDGELVQADDMNRIERGIEDAEGAAGGLADRLAAVEYDSGWRNITSTLAEAPQSGRVLLRRNGKIVHLHVDALTYSSDAPFKSWGPVIPSGFRP